MNSIGLEDLEAYVSQLAGREAEAKARVLEVRRRPDISVSFCCMFKHFIVLIVFLYFCCLTARLPINWRKRQKKLRGPRWGRCMACSSLRDVFAEYSNDLSLSRLLYSFGLCEAQSREPGDPRGIGKDHHAGTLRPALKS